MNRTSHPALAEHMLQTENEKLRAALRATTKASSAAEVGLIVDDALSQQAEPAQDDDDYLPEGLAEAAMNCDVVDAPAVAAQALRQQLSAPAQDEREAFEACMILEAGPGAADLWIKGNPGAGYSNERVNDYRFGWVACLEWMSARPAQTEQQQPVAWLPYLSDGADGVTGHYAIARKNPAGYREVWNLRRHRWAAFSDDVLTMDEALAILKKLEMPAAPIAQTAPQPEQSALVEALRRAHQQFKYISEGGRFYLSTAAEGMRQTHYALSATPSPTENGHD